MQAFHRFISIDRYYSGLTIFATSEKICYSSTMSQVVMKNRINHLWYFLSWIICLSFVVIIYHTLIESDIFAHDPSGLVYLDHGFIILRDLFVILMVTNIVSLIFHEIRYYFSMEHLMVRKFLPTIRFVVLFCIWVLWGFITLEEIGVNTSGLLAWAGIGWVIFALASKDLIANLLGSLSIIMSKTFEIGETIRVKWVEGIVEEINLNYTKIMSDEGKVIFMPNRVLNTEQIENLSRRRFYIHTFKVPFKKSGGDPDFIRDTLMLIEWKINEYAPMEIEIKSEIPNATDFVYIFNVTLPEENEEFETEIRNYLISYIFPRESK